MRKSIARQKASATTPLIKQSTSVPPSKDLLYTIEGQPKNIKSLQLIIYYLGQHLPNNKHINTIVRSIINMFEYDVTYSNQKVLNTFITALQSINDTEYQRAIANMKSDTNVIATLRAELLTPSELELPDQPVTEGEVEGDIDEIPENEIPEGDIDEIPEDVNEGEVEDINEVEGEGDIDEIPEAEDVNEGDIDEIPEAEDVNEGDIDESDLLDDDDTEVVDIIEPSFRSIDEGPEDNDIEPSIPSRKLTYDQLKTGELHRLIEESPPNQ